MGEDLKFRVSSGIKDIVGKDLITDDFIAVYELVKNSYDAYANNVIITFEESRIIISDDGKGMSLKDIKDKWLFLAYSAKKDGSEDDELKNRSYRDLIQKERHYAGAKGVGRFSVDRLGEELIMTTKTDDLDFSEQIVIDWNMFNNQNKEFSEVNVKHTTINTYKLDFPNKSNHGLILEINKTTFWNREKILALKHSLEKLINPFASSDSFNISVKCLYELRNDQVGTYTKKQDKGKRYRLRDRINGSVKNAILEVLNLKTTQISIIIKNNIIETKIHDRKELIYHIREDASPFSLIKEMNIDLYYLNRAAKIQFKKLMGIEPVKFGSVLLFKNGFRVMPYGEFGDDSWGINLKSQQGYGRHLSTRNLFGRVDITTDNTIEFKEVSSRDGGLVKSRGSNELFDVFNIVLKRLERYVVGVLWGEGFRRKNYFGEGEDAIKEVEKQRSLLILDKDSENFDVAKNNIGSALDFVQIIKSLSSNDDIEVVNFNKDIVQNINTKLDKIEPKFITDINNVIEQIDDPKFMSSLENTKIRFQKELDKKEQEIKEEEQKRKKAEVAKEEEEQKRKKAEVVQKLEARRRVKAEQEARESEEKRIRAENATLKAEQKVRESEEKRSKAEIATLKAENATLKAQSIADQEKKKRENAEKDTQIEKDKNTYLVATRNLSDDADEFSHSIKLASGAINTSLIKILKKIKTLLSVDIMISEEIANIHTLNTNITHLTELITKSNFKADDLSRKINISMYILQYLNIYKIGYKDKITIRIVGSSAFIRTVNVLDLSIVIDNLVSNSIKAKANEILIKFHDIEKKLEVIFSDNGNGLGEEFIHTPNSIFELGVKTMGEGSGIGLYSVCKRMKNMRGNVKYIGDNIELKGATFKLTFIKK